MPISDLRFHPYQSNSGNRDTNNNPYVKKSIFSEENQEKGWTQVIQEAVTSKTSDEKKSNPLVGNKVHVERKVLNLLNNKEKAPYSNLAKNGLITYNKVTFVCDTEHNALCLGDTSDMNKCLRIPLSEGGSLIVNRKCLGALAKAIGMFSPEDMKRIMDAMALENKIQKIQKNIDDTKNSAGEVEDK